MKEKLKNIAQDVIDVPTSIVELKDFDKHIPKLQEKMKSLLQLGFEGSGLGHLQGNIEGREAMIVYNPGSDYPYSFSVGQGSISYIFSKEGFGMDMNNQSKHLSALELLFSTYATIDLLEQNGF